MWSAPLNYQMEECKRIQRVDRGGNIIYKNRFTLTYIQCCRDITIAPNDPTNPHRQKELWVRLDTVAGEPWNCRQLLVQKFIKLALPHCKETRGKIPRTDDVHCLRDPASMWCICDMCINDCVQCLNILFVTCNWFWGNIFACYVYTRI